jgi:acyl-CoA synthetase (AMP-forming)/AMP-acid ligase II
VHREGTVGKPIPDVRVRVTDLESGAELGPGKAGMLWVNGPNVMKGYQDRQRNGAACRGRGGAGRAGRFGRGGGLKAVVVSIPDPAKGERLVVVHIPLALTPDELVHGLAQAGLQNLFIPARDSFVLVDELPHGGTGKLGIRRITRVAQQAMDGRREPHRI